MNNHGYPTLAVALLCAVCSSGQAALDLELDTELMMALDPDRGSAIQADLLVVPKASWSMGNQTEVVLSARLRGSLANDINGKPRQLDTYTRASRPWNEERLTAELRDVYIERQFGTSRLTLGKQQIVWGALDGIKLLDSVNPQDFREFILDDFDDSRISQWAAHLEWPFAGGYLELAAVPDTSVHELPGPGAQFAFSARRYRYGLAVGAGTGLGEGVLTRRTARADDPLRDGTYALRYSRFSAGWDLAGSIINGPDHAPVAELRRHESGQAVLEAQHRARLIVGLSATKSFGPFAVRTELAWRPSRAFNRLELDQATATPLTTTAAIDALGEALSVVRRDQASAAIALDWQAPLSLFVNLQLLHEQILNHDSRLVTPEKDTLTTALVRRSFRYDTVVTELRWLANLADGDGLVRPSVSYQLDDDTLVRLGADLFYGDSQGIFGQFDQADQLTLSLQRIF